MSRMEQQPLPRIQGVMKSPLNFCALLDEIPMGIVLMDLHFRVVFVNHVFEAMTGYSALEARGIPCRHIIRSRERVSAFPGNSRLQGDAPVTIESDIITRDRQRLPVRITLATLVDEEGTVTGYLESLENIREVKSAKAGKSKAYSFSDIVGRSPQMEKLFQTVPILAQSDTSILITGETGTGKDLVAEAIHQTSTGPPAPLSRLTAGHCRKPCWNRRFSAIAKAPSQGLWWTSPAGFSWPTTGPYF